jgi:hypothetical protein
MADHLRVDLDELTEAGRSLKALREEFDRSGELSDGVGDALGHDGLADAVHDFATNWKYHRQKLGGALDAVADMATESAKTYRETDDQLADKIRESQQDSTVGSAR